MSKYSIYSIVVYTTFYYIIHIAVWIIDKVGIEVSVRIKNAHILLLLHRIYITTLTTTAQCRGQRTIL